MAKFYKLNENDSGVAVGSGSIVPDGFTVFTEENKPQELINALGADPVITEELVVSIIEKVIQDEVNSYNEANGVAFGGVHNCHTYHTVMDYTHQPWCSSMVQWNADLWEAMRTWKDTLVSTPTFLEVQQEIAKTPFSG